MENIKRRKLEKDNIEIIEVDKTDPVLPFSTFVDLFSYTKEDIQKIIKEREIEYEHNHVQQIKENFEKFLKHPENFPKFRVVSRREYHNDTIYYAERVPDSRTSLTFLSEVPCKKLREGVYYFIPVHVGPKTYQPQDNRELTSDKALEKFKHLVHYCDRSIQCYYLYVKVG